MKKVLIVSCMAATLLIAQEKNTNIPLARVAGPAMPNNRTTNAFTYVPADVKVLGDLDDGRPGSSLYSVGKSHYHAFVFSAYGGQKVDIKVTGTGRRPFVALADSTLNQLASSTGNITFSLPYHGPYIEVWYVLFRDLENKPSHFTVQVKKFAAAGTQVARSDD